MAAQSSQPLAPQSLAPQVGDLAPAFDLPSAPGPRLASGDLNGQAYVIYFYPKDDTPGCTIEAQDFETLSADFADQGVRVIGVSKDSLTSHEKFQAKYNLNFTLLTDEQAELCQAYGVWTEKTNFGKTSMGIVRSTFLIAADGKVAKVWRNVRAKGHAAAVLEAAQSLESVSA